MYAFPFQDMQNMKAHKGKGKINNDFQLYSSITFNKLLILPLQTFLFFLQNLPCFFSIMSFVYHYDFFIQ